MPTFIFTFFLGRVKTHWGAYKRGVWETSPFFARGGRNQGTCTQEGTWGEKEGVAREGKQNQSDD